VHQIAADEVGSALKACRICFEEESPNENLKEVLVSPCACRGSSAQVHLCCLQQWHLTGTRPAPLRCPTCKQAYFGSVAVVLARLNLNRAEKDALPYLSQILLSPRSLLPCALQPDPPSTELTEAKPSLHQLLAALNDLANSLCDMGQYEEALPLYQRSLHLREVVCGPQHPAVARALHNLASLLKAGGWYEEAQKMYERALQIREAALGVAHPLVAESISSLAGLLRLTGKELEFDAVCERALQIRAVLLETTADPEAGESEGLPWEDQAETARGGKASCDSHSACTLSSLAQLFSDMGNYEEAAPLFERSLALREKALGATHVDVATSLNNLAVLLRKQGRYDEALPLYERSLAILTKTLGPDHPNVASALNNLAGLLKNQGRVMEAVPHYKRSLAIFERSLGGFHPNVAVLLVNMAQLYLSQGIYKDAKLLYERALVIKAKMLGADHPETTKLQSNLAAVSSAMSTSEAAPSTLPVHKTWLDCNTDSSPMSPNSTLGMEGENGTQSCTVKDLADEPETQQATGADSCISES